MLLNMPTPILHPAHAASIARASYVQTFINICKRLNTDNTEFWYRSLNY